jgi:hypothetical protein
MAAQDDGRVPSLAHLHEEVIARLKTLPLFVNVSRRLLDDLVANVGIETAEPAIPDAISGREPIVLLVLERPVLLFLPAKPPIRLLPGAYLRDHPPFGDSGTPPHAWALSQIRTADQDRNRVFLLDRRTLVRLPQIVLQALDHVELERLKLFFS